MSQPDRATRAGLLLGSGVAMGTLVPVALYQLGLLRHLPDPPSALFDSDGIASSKAAHPLGVPDSLLGLVNFGATFALALAVEDCPKARKLLRVKLAMDGGAAAFNFGRQVWSFRRLCSWCTGTSVAALATVWVGRGLLRGDAGEERRQEARHICE